LTSNGSRCSFDGQPGLAADDCTAARQLELAPASQAKEKQLLVQLRAFFTQEPVKAITAKRITDYRTWRANQTVKTKRDDKEVEIRCAGPATLNAELGILRRILKRAKLWARVAEDAVHRRANGMVSRT
jgi:hypothetical protein